MGLHLHLEAGTEDRVGGVHDKRKGVAVAIADSFDVEVSAVEVKGPVFGRGRRERERDLADQAVGFEVDRDPPVEGGGARLLVVGEGVGIDARHPASWHDRGDGVRSAGATPARRRWCPPSPSAVNRRGSLDGV